MVGLCGRLLVLVACVLLPSCGLVKAPFRVAGAVVDTAYIGGKKVAKNTSDALEKRKLRKEKEKEEQEAEAKEAKGSQQKAAEPQQQGLLPPPDSMPVNQGPIIPLDDQPIPPVEPLPLPQ